MAKKKKAEKKEPEDCTSCRIVGSIGLVGIGGYLSGAAWKNKTKAGRVVVSALSFSFVLLGVSRYRRTWPFDKTAKQVQ